MPDDEGALAASQTLVISEATFRPGVGADPGRRAGRAAHVGDLRPLRRRLSPLPRSHRVRLRSRERSAPPSARAHASPPTTSASSGWIASSPRATPTSTSGGAVRSSCSGAPFNAGNYDYVMYYSFWDDGTIEVRAARPAGRSTGPTTPPATPHVFAWRIDLDVAGAGGDTASIENVSYGGKAVKRQAAARHHRGWLRVVARGPSRTSRSRTPRASTATGASGPTRSPRCARACRSSSESWTRYPIWVTRGHGAGEELRALRPAGATPTRRASRARTSCSGTSTPTTTKRTCATRIATRSPCSGSASALSPEPLEIGPRSTSTLDLRRAFRRCSTRRMSNGRPLLACFSPTCSLAGRGRPA